MHRSCLHSSSHFAAVVVPSRSRPALPIHSLCKTSVRARASHRAPMATCLMRVCAVLICDPASAQCKPCGIRGGPCCPWPLAGEEEDDYAAARPFYQCMPSDDDNRSIVCSALVNGTCKDLSEGELLSQLSCLHSDLDPMRCTWHSLAACLHRPSP